MSVDAGNRSGTIHDDYIEEPVSGKSKQYEPALVVSNVVLELFKSGKFEEISSQYVEESTRANMDAETLRSLYEGMVQQIGPISAYKDLQWGFVRKRVDGQDLLYSIKIVEHEKATLSYYFVFNDDGDYRQFVGLHVKERDGVRPAAQL